MDSHDQWCPHQIKHVPLFSSHLRYVEGRGDVHTFLSVPISSEEAEETRREFRERLVKHARALFGDTTVKMSLVLSHCLHIDSELYINDIAETQEEGLYFHD